MIHNLTKTHIFPFNGIFTNKSENQTGATLQVDVKLGRRTDIFIEVTGISNLKLNSTELITWGSQDLSNLAYTSELAPIIYSQVIVEVI